MKKYWSLFLLLPVFVMAQQTPQNYDYFVQCNTPTFVQKVPLERILQHKLFTKDISNTSSFKFADFASCMDTSKPMVMHGNVTDSLSYYQISIPIVNGQKVQQFLEKRVAQNAQDSIVETIKTFPKYQVYSPNNESFSVAWNSNYLVVYGVLDSNNNSASDIGTIEELPTTGMVVEEKVEEIQPIEDAPVEEIKESKKEDNNATEETVLMPSKSISDTDIKGDSEVEEEAYDDAYYQKQDEEYRKEQEQKRLAKIEKQEAQIALLFANGFMLPTSSKVNTTSDISTWINYQKLSSKMTAFYYSLSALFPNKKLETSDNVVKGMNMDMYFENDKSRMVQTIEYSESMAKMMQKVVCRKPNKDTYLFFPKKEPIGYMSYHFNSEEILKLYPQITEQFWMNLPIEKQDAQIVTDLLSTIIDEKATATLMDGDVSVFWHSTENYRYTYKNKSFNEDYEEVEEDKTIVKTRPIFSVVMTSSHETMLPRLLDLGVRKNVLVKENDYYRLKETSEEIGDLIFKKSGDAFVITNGWNYLSEASNSDFIKQFKKDIRQNYMIGNLNMEKMTKQLSKSVDMDKDVELIQDFGNQFNSLQFHSPKKIKNNLATFEMEMTTKNSTQNSILTMLDFLAKF